MEKTLLGSAGPLKSRFSGRCFVAGSKLCGRGYEKGSNLQVRRFVEGCRRKNGADQVPLILRARYLGRENNSGYIGTVYSGRRLGLMKTVYDFFVSGIPKAQPRHRNTRARLGQKLDGTPFIIHGHIYTPDSVKEWKEIVSAEFMARRQPVITQPVKLTVYFYIPSPKSNKKQIEDYPHTKKPDADNLVKAVMDAMTEANVWTDDALVFAPLAEKWYSSVKTGARIKVEVWEG